MAHSSLSGSTAVQQLLPTSLSPGGERSQPTESASTFVYPHSKNCMQNSDHNYSWHQSLNGNFLAHHGQVYVFGPGGLPVSSAGCLTPLSLSSLADWETFGLSLTPPQDLHDSSKGIGEFLYLKMHQDFCLFLQGSMEWRHVAFVN